MFFLKLLSRLPLRVLFLLSDFVFVIGYYVIRYRRNVVQRNLRNSFPEKSEKELHAIERKFYRNLCDYPIETLKLMTISEKELTKRMRFKNKELADSYAAQGKSALFLTAHQFNWEMILTSFSIQFKYRLNYVYQSQSSEFFDGFSNIIRQRFGAIGFLREKVGREMLKIKGQVHGTAIVADQFPGLGHDKRYWTTFLHQDTAFFQGMNQLAVMTQYPVIFFMSRKIKRGYYECELIPIAEPPYAKDDYVIVENYIKETEKIIREQPEGWLWSHDRWKRTRVEMGDELS